jgi:hypothetical protein
MKKLLSITLFMMLGLFCFAQAPQVLFYGYVEEGVFENPNSTKRKKKDSVPQKLKGVKIYIYHADSVVSIVEARETGFYAVLLESDKVYRVTFEKEGYFCKSFELNCNEVKYPDDDAAMKCLTDVSLFKKVDDADLLSLCKVPFAKCAYNNSTGDMEWDLEYTARAKTKFYELAQPYYMASEK